MRITFVQILGGMLIATGLVGPVAAQETAAEAAARMSGAPAVSIIARHIVPNLLGVVAVVLVPAALRGSGAGDASSSTKLSKSNALLFASLLHVVPVSMAQSIDYGSDCVVAFSRREIFSLRQRIEASSSLSCSVVYGSLPPETRKAQAARFNDSTQPERVLVASDAIGMGLNLDIFKDMLWEYLGLVRVYTKPRGKKPDFDDPLILTEGRHGISIESACKQIHRSLLTSFDYAMVWGTSVKHTPQRVGLAHTLHDEDVIQIVKKKGNQKELDAALAYFDKLKPSCVDAGVREPAD